MTPDENDLLTPKERRRRQRERYILNITEPILKVGALIFAAAGFFLVGGAGYTVFDEGIGTALIFFVLGLMMLWCAGEVYPDRES